MLYNTPLLDIIDAPADRRHRGGLRLEPPQFIVLHHTGPWPALTWLTTDAHSDVSAHRYIEPNKPIYKLVEDSQVAFTQGFAEVGPWSSVKKRNFNQVCLSIEGCYNPDTQHQWDLDVVWKMATQVCEWWGRYGFLPVVYHAQIDDRKVDPMRFPREHFDAFLGRLVYRGLSGTLTTWSHQLLLPPGMMPES